MLSDLKDDCGLSNIFTVPLIQDSTAIFQYLKIAATLPLLTRVFLPSHPSSIKLILKQDKIGEGKMRKHKIKKSNLYPPFWHDWQRTCR